MKNLVAFLNTGKERIAMATEIDVNSLLNRIAESKKKFSFPIFIPSLDREVPFFQLTTAQQKMFVKASMSNMDEFTNIMYSLFAIIKENCADPEVDVSKFTIVDKLLVTIAMRMVSISPIYKVVINDLPNEDGKPTNASIDLNTICKRIIKKFKGQTFAETLSTEGTDIKLSIGLPTIGTEVSIEKDIEQKARKDATSDDSDVSSSAVGELYVLECLKFVKSITVPVEGGDDVTTNIENLPSKEKMKIIESLPSGLTSKLVDRVNDILKDLNSVYLLKIKDKEGKDHTYTLDFYSSDFFIGS